MDFLEISYGKDFSEEIPKFVSFDKTEKRSRQVMRWILLASVFSLEIAFVLVWGWEHFFNQMKNFTCWNLVVTIIFHVIQLMATSNNKDCLGVLAAVHIAFEISATFNVIMCCVYWPLIHPYDIVKYSDPA